MALPASAWLLAVALAAAPAAQAATSAQDHFREGVAAFRDGDYRQAAARFEAARDRGLTSPALLHNLGVSYYRLRRHREAAQAFRALAEDPRNRGLAHYNLGLVALARERPGRARGHFQTAREQADDDRIRRLADERLAELADTGDPGGASRFSALVSASLGYSDNVTLAPDDLVTATDSGDGFWEYLAAGSFRLAGDPRNGFQLKGSLLGTDYFDLDRFDQTYLRAGLEWDRPWGPWDTDLAAYADRVRLGGEGFETIYTGEAEGLRPLTGGWRLRLRYRFSHIEAQGPFDYLTGSRHRAALAGRYRGDVKARLGYELEANDRRDRETADTFTSVSPTRHRVFLAATYPFASGWEAKAQAAFRRSRYADANTDAATGFRRVREDDRVRLQAGLSRQLPWGLRALAEVEHTDNNSNIPDYTYTATRYRLGLEGFF